MGELNFDYQNKTVENENENSFQEIKQSIEIPAPETERKPRINISKFGLEQFSNLEKNLKFLEKENGIFTITRCFNRDEEEMGEFVEKMKRFKDNIPNLQGVFLMISNEDDEDNITENSLINTLEEKNIELPLVPIKVENYTWTSGLNSGVAILNELSEKYNILKENVKIMNLSFDVDIEDEQLKNYTKNIDNNFIFTARKTIDNKSPFFNGVEDDFVWEELKGVLKFPEKFSVGKLISQYTMRNTFNLVSLKDIVNLGGFNPECNKEGGMEDTEFFTRLILNFLKSKNITAIKELKKAVNNPILYSNKDGVRYNRDEQMKKIFNEMEALSSIINNFKNIDNSQDFSIPREAQDFNLRK